MRKIICIGVSFIVALSFFGCSGSDSSSSSEKSKFDVMVDVLNAMNAVGEDEAGYNRSVKSVSRAKLLEESSEPEIITIAPGFVVTLTYSIVYNENEWIFNILMSSQLTNYTSDGYTLNGTFSEQYIITMLFSGEQITGLSEKMILDGTVDFSGKETGSFAFDNFIIQFQINPNTGTISDITTEGKILFDGVDVTDEFFGVFKEGFN